jgi:hypothetical protein
MPAFFKRKAQVVYAPFLSKYHVSVRSGTCLQAVKVALIGFPFFSAVLKTRIKSVRAPIYCIIENNRPYSISTVPGIHSVFWFCIFNESAQPLTVNIMQ